MVEKTEQDGTGRKVPYEVGIHSYNEKAGGGGGGGS